MYLQKSILFLLLSITLFACKFFQQEVKIEESPVARVNDIYLYPSDIVKINIQGLDEIDSVKQVKKQINDWVLEQLMLDVAKKNVLDYESKIKDRVENFRNELIIYLYSKELILQKLDTFVSPNEIKNYYAEFQNNFIARTDLYNINYVIFPKGIEETNSIRKWFQRLDDKSRANLGEWCDNNIISCELNNNNWLSLDEASFILPLNNYYSRRLKSINFHFEIQDSTHTYMFKTTQYIKAGSQAPLEYVSKNIENIHLDKRKVALIKDTYDEIYKEGIKNNAFQIYN